MKLHVKADRYQFILSHGDKAIGYYTSMATLMQGALTYLQKSKSKGGTDLRNLIELAVNRNAHLVEQIRQMAENFYRASVSPTHTDLMVPPESLPTEDMVP